MHQIIMTMNQEAQLRKTRTHWPMPKTDLKASWEKNALPTPPYGAVFEGANSLDYRYFSAKMSE